MRSRGFARLGLIPLAHVVLGAAMTLLVAVWGLTEGDPVVLMPIADRLVHGVVAYRDYAVEYPPLGLVAIVLPRFLSGADAGRYQTWFSVLSLALAVATAAGVWSLARRRWAAESPLNATLMFAGLALAGAPLVVWRFDILPAFLTTLALVAYAAGRPGWSGMALGFGTLAKIYPAALLPVFAAAHLFERQLRPAALLVCGATIAVLAVLAETYLVAGSGALSFLSYQQDRGVEIESITGGLALLGAVFGGQPAHVALGFGSWQVTSPMIGSLSFSGTVFNVAIVVVLLTCAWISFTRDARDGRDVNSSRVIQPRTLVQYSLATLLAVVLTNKVLSPQYLVWLLPLVALLPARRSLAFLLIVGLTTWVYPLTFHSLVTMEGPAVLLLNVRNAALVVFYVWIVWPYELTDDARELSAAPSERRYVREPAD